MNDIASILSLALLPALGNIAGGILAEVYRPSPRVLNWALHLAAGIVIGIVAIELTPNALQVLPTWLVGVCFLLGAGGYQLAERGVAYLQEQQGSGETESMWMIYFAVAVDLFSDGLMIGSGAAVSAGLGLAIAIGQVLADVPEGFAVIANFRNKGVSRTRRFALSASFAVPALTAALGAFLLLRQQSQAWQMGVLLGTAGILTTAAIEDMISEAHATEQDGRFATSFLAMGFGLFAFVSNFLNRG